MLMHSSFQGRGRVKQEFGVYAVESPDVTVMIQVRNRVDSLPTALAHLEQQTFPSAYFEIVILDHGSTDGTHEMLLRYASGAPVPIRTLSLPGPAAGQLYNLGLKEARGDKILFLHQDLLASPHLLTHHMEAHERSGPGCCIIGEVAAHPQLPPGTQQPLPLPVEQRTFNDSEVLHFADWEFMNLSVSRQMILDAGGFDEAFVLPYFDDIELASRLSKRGATGHFAANASAYYWRPLTLEEHRNIYYGRGYSLALLSSKIETRVIQERYRLRPRPLRFAFGRLFKGASAQLCTHLDPATQLFQSLHRRILWHDLYTGYRDARKGWAPRPGRVEV